MEKTNGGFLISQIKQIQGRVFERLLLEAGIERTFDNTALEECLEQIRAFVRGA